MKVICSEPDLNFEEFYFTFYPKVLGWLRMRCHTPQDAEELANECFLYCYKNWDSYDPLKAPQSAWLFMIVRCRWKNYLRAFKPMDNIDDLIDRIPAESEMEKAVWLSQLRDDLADALLQLSDQQRKAIALRFFTDKTDKEIAATLKVSTGNLRVIIYRALRKLESLLPSEWKEKGYDQEG